VGSPLPDAREADISAQPAIENTISNIAAHQD